MRVRVLGSIWILVAFSLASGCSAPPPKLNFLHRALRETYAIQDPEFPKLQFFISKEVLAQVDTGMGTTPRQDQVVILEKETPGVVTEVGSNWLRVGFGAGPGLYFVTDDRREEDLYWLATPVQGERGLYRVKDLRTHVIYHEGETYRVIRGADAVLLVNGADMNDLIQKRTHVKGRKPVDAR